MKAAQRLKCCDSSDEAHRFRLPPDCLVPGASVSGKEGKFKDHRREREVEEERGGGGWKVGWGRNSDFQSSD